jgi:hypothetical protein
MLVLKQEFMSYDNAPKNWDVLEFKYFISPNISEMLKEIQTGNGQRQDGTFIKKYGFEKINCDGLSFAEHIERTIEMFS